MLSLLLTLAGLGVYKIDKINEDIKNRQIIAEMNAKQGNLKRFCPIMFKEIYTKFYKDFLNEGDLLPDWMDEEYLEPARRDRKAFEALIFALAQNEEFEMGYVPSYYNNFDVRTYKPFKKYEELRDLYYEKKKLGIE